MILQTVFGIKIFLAILIQCLIWIYFRKKIDYAKILFAELIILIFAFISSGTSNLIPSLTDNVTLTALGEKSDNAKGMEVYLRGYTIDNHEYISGESLKVVEGHWFWSGEVYAWRPESDLRQPLGTTRSIVLKIPVGWNRTLDFAGDIWRGKVEIETDNNLIVFNTFSETQETLSIAIGRSNSLKLVINQSIRLLLYILLFLGMTTLFAFFILSSSKRPGFIQYLLTSGKLIYVCISISILIFMVHGADKFPLWADEMGQIVFTNGSLSEATRYCLEMYDVSPPLPAWIFTIWYKLIPYGERWLFLITIIPSALSIYFVGLAGEKFLNRTSGILSALFMGFSTTMWMNVAYEYRPYPFLVLFSTLSLYSYVSRNTSNAKFKWDFLFSLSLLGMTMSHYFGIIACGCFFFADLYLLNQGKIKIKNYMAYLLPGIFTFSWLLCVYTTIMGQGGPSGGITWQPIPGFSNIQYLLYFLSGNYELTYLLLLGSISVSLVYFLLYRTENIFIKYFHFVFLGVSIVGTIMILVIWGRFICNQYTMWSDRYFLFLMPMVCVLSAFTIVHISQILIKADQTNRVGYTICTYIAVICSLHCFSVISGYVRIQPYRESADWIYEQSNTIFNRDTIIISTSHPESWNEYYISRKGRRDSLNVRGMEIAEEGLTDYNRVYIQYSHSPISEKLQKELDEDFFLESELVDLEIKVYSRNLLES